MEVARAGHPGTPPLKCRQPVVHICPCPQSLLALFMSHFPSDIIEVGIIFQGSSSVDVCLKGRGVLRSVGREVGLGCSWGGIPTL